MTLSTKLSISATMALIAASFFFSFFLSVFVLAGLASAQYPPMKLTLVNNCPFTVWPAIQANAGHEVLLRGGGLALQTVSHYSFPAPTSHWSGRIWARTGCAYDHSRFSCATGDCGGRLECGGLGGAVPTTLAQITLHHGVHRDLTSYGVSLVDGYNVGMTVTPHLGRGRCPVVGCRPQVDLLKACPDVLQVRAPAAGGAAVVGCKSGCAAFGTDELCCRNKYNSAGTCRANTYSKFFKKECPDTFTYAHDSPTVMHDCEAPQELKIIFCH